MARLLQTVQTEQSDILKQPDIGTKWYIFIALLLHTVQSEQSDIPNLTLALSGIFLLGGIERSPILR